jgi:hypothetical protein
MRLMRFFLVLFMSFALASCSGTGSKNYAVVSQTIDTSKGGVVFLKREEGFVGSGALFTVILNGNNIGKLGTGEVVTGELVSGTNTLQVDVKGIQGMGLSPAQSVFENSDGNNRFFNVGLKMGLFLNSLSLIETTEASFKNNM